MARSVTHGARPLPGRLLALRYHSFPLHLAARFLNLPGSARYQPEKLGDQTSSLDGGHYETVAWHGKRPSDSGLH